MKTFNRIFQVFALQALGDMSTSARSKHIANVAEDFKL